MTLTKQERIARAPGAISERIERARNQPAQVTALTDKVFTVANGDGNAYEVSFTQTSTGACACEDFTTRGRLLCMCKHTAAVVLTQWPDNFARWAAKVRELSAATLAALPDDPAPEPELVLAEPRAPQAAVVPVTVDDDLVAAVIEAALPIVLEIVMDTLAANAEAIAVKTAAILRTAQ